MPHTPGPWIVFHSDEDGPNDVLPAMRPGHIALSIAVDADASLIAAAPDLLRELQAMVETFDGYQGMELKRAKAAIAKAVTVHG